eukprot:GHVN01090318.1.p1 GENE.GHVN01090318.1~~GHVN01090318.1.p1  ORF type:complete len:197 (-),score=7.71 GHVN01090318.1:11-601(-)
MTSSLETNLCMEEIFTELSNTAAFRRTGWKTLDFQRCLLSKLALTQHGYCLALTDFTQLYVSVASEQSQMVNDLKMDQGPTSGALRKGPQAPNVSPATTTRETIIRRQDRTRQFRDTFRDVTGRAPSGQQLPFEGQARLVLYYCPTHYGTFMALSGLAQRVRDLPPPCRERRLQLFHAPVNEVPQYIVPECSTPFP